MKVLIWSVILKSESINMPKFFITLVLVMFTLLIVIFIFESSKNDFVHFIPNTIKHDFDGLIENYTLQYTCKSIEVFVKKT